MNALVLTNRTGKDITTSLIIAEVFGKNHADVLRDVRNLYCSNEFRESNFALLVEMKKLPQGGASKSEHYEITKNGFSFLVMGYSGEKAGEFKEKFINEFDKREAMLRNDDYIVARSQEILGRRMKALEQQIHQKDEQLQLQQHVIKEAAPKVAYYEQVLQSDSLIPTTIIAKELGISTVRLNKLLYQLAVIYKVGNTWVLYEKYQDKGYASTKTHFYYDKLGNVQAAVQLYWYQVGREFIHKIIREHNLLN